MTQFTPENPINSDLGITYTFDEAAIRSLLMDPFIVEAFRGNDPETLNKLAVLLAQFPAFRIAFNTYLGEEDFFQDHPIDEGHQIIV